MRVVVSLATIPTREESVIKTIESLRKGTYLPDEIYVNIPEWYVRFDRAPDPNLILKLNEIGVKINTCKDYCTLNKIIPILDIENDPSTLIIGVDDDAEYHPRLIEGLVLGYNKFKTPVGYSGCTFPLNNECCRTRTGHGTVVDMVDGVYGRAFPRWSLNGFPHFEPMTKESEECLYLSDDLVIGKFIEFKQIKTVALFYPYIGRDYPEEKHESIAPMKIIEGSQTYRLSGENTERYHRLLELQLLDSIFGLQLDL
jgi:hypothetical protein